MVAAKGDCNTPMGLHFGALSVRPRGIFTTWGSNLSQWHPTLPPIGPSRPPWVVPGGRKRQPGTGILRYLAWGPQLTTILLNLFFGFGVVDSVICYSFTCGCGITTLPPPLTYGGARAGCRHNPTPSESIYGMVGWAEVRRETRHGR